MNNLWYISVLILSVFSLKTERNSNFTEVKKNLDTIEVSRFKKVNLPLGNKNLILTKFPKKWRFKDFTNNEPQGNPIYSKNTYSYYKSEILYDRFHNSIRTKYFNLIDTIKSSYAGIEKFTSYSCILPSAFSKKKLTYYPFAKFKAKNNYSVLILLATNISEDYSRLQAISIDKKHRIIDGLDIYLHDETQNYINFIKLFYIDKNDIFHIKDFIELEDLIYFKGYEQYQILPNGRFARHYEKNGFFKNTEEYGTVKNYKREGKWIEIKPNRYVNLQKNKNFLDNYTYLEAMYKDGLPIGKWKFYKLVQAYDERNTPILSTRKSGKLIYTETYQNYNIIKRFFLN